MTFYLPQLDCQDVRINIFLNVFIFSIKDSIHSPFFPYSFKDFIKASLELEKL